MTNTVKNKTSKVVTSKLEKIYGTEIFNSVKSRYQLEVWNKLHSSCKEDLLMNEKINRDNKTEQFLNFSLDEVQKVRNTFKVSLSEIENKFGSRTEFMKKMKDSDQSVIDLISNSKKIDTKNLTNSETVIELV